MSSFNIIRETPIIRTPRVMQLESIFDLPVLERSQLSWTINLPIEEKEWSIGLIVGPSRSGKTTIVRELFKDHIIESFDWDSNKAIIDSFPSEMSIQEIIELLSSIGFSSPPSWLRPYHVLSNGEKFRVFIARALAEKKDMVVVDEFTSVVDRTVAKITSHSVQKIVRRRKQKFVAVSCHYDIIEWLQPDWIYEASTNVFSWSEGLQRRPPIEMEIKRVSKTAWNIFKAHHYLSSSLPMNSHCYVAFIQDEPVAFCAIRKFPGMFRFDHWIIARIVVLPDYQGIGIGRTITTYVASLYSTIGIVFIVTSQPAMIKGLQKSLHWRMVRKPSLSGKHSRKSMMKTSAWNRMTTTFVYMGLPNYEDAKKFEILK